jgi:hypothetical protein
VTKTAASASSPSLLVHCVPAVGCLRPYQPAWLAPDVTAGVVTACVVVPATGLITPAAFRRLARIRTRDFGFALVALAGVLVFGILDGVLIAIAVSLVTVLYQTNSRPVEVLGRETGDDVLHDLSRHPAARPVPGTPSMCWRRWRQSSAPNGSTRGWPPHSGDEREMGRRFGTDGGLRSFDSVADAAAAHEAAPPR